MSGPKTFSPVVPSCRGIDPFEILKWKKRKKSAGKKEGCLATPKREEGSRLAELRLCWFSSPDFTPRDKSWSVMEGCMAVVSTWTATTTILV